MRQKILTIIALFLIIVMTILSCKKANEDEKQVVVTNKDNIDGRKIRYIVLVISGSNSSLKSGNHADSAIVSVSMNDSIYSKSTDTSGIASFDFLNSGNAAVSVRHKDHTTVSYIVDLTMQDKDKYDSNNIRTASTMVALFPINGSQIATIKGMTFADLNLTIAGNEVAPGGLNIHTVIESSQLLNYVNHSSAGKITQIAYSNSTNNTQTDANGNYSINVPASGRGLKIIVYSDDFAYNQTIAVNSTQRKIYKFERDTLLVFSSGVNFQDIDYK